MANVFVSYSKRDKPYAEELSKFLEDLGLTTWWDTELIGGEEFRKRIVSEIESANVVIVIWSPNSIKSHFVIDEADYARAQGKLISATVPGLSAERIPIGFRGAQTVPLGDGERLVQALVASGAVDVRRGGSYLLHIFGRQIRAIEKTTRKTYRLALVGMSLLIAGGVGFAAVQLLLRPSLKVVNPIISLYRQVNDKLVVRVSANMTFYFSASGRIGEYLSPTYVVRDFQVLLYGQDLERLLDRSEKKNMVVRYGSSITPSIQGNFPLVWKPKAERFAVVCASLSRGGSQEVEFRMGVAERFVEADDARDLRKLDLAEDHLAALQRDSQCPLTAIH